VKVKYQKFKKLIYDETGVHLSESKENVVCMKIEKIVEQHNLESSEELYKIVKDSRNSEIKSKFIDKITIHKTNFFREISHFDCIRTNINKILEANKSIVNEGELRVWSAACSSGEEPYSIALLLNELLKDKNIDIKILGTDISSGVLEKAMRGEYPKGIKSDVESKYLTEGFELKDDKYKVSREIRRMVTFRKFNLMSRFPFKKKFDIIFCRNVMIYFGEKERRQLIEKMKDSLAPNGLLFLGLTEPIIYNDETVFKKISSSVYVKKS